MNVQLDEYTIPVTIVRKSNKNIYFRFKEDGNLYVTCRSFCKINAFTTMNEKGTCEC